jgi:hypothetical protein
MTLIDNGWSEQQASGLLDSLKLNGSSPNWKPEHVQRLHEYCAARAMDPKAIDSQLEFVAHDLLNSFQGICIFLKRAKTVEEAREAVQIYVRQLKAGK